MNQKEIDWNFPSNNHGERVGISEAGVETFKGNLFSSLAREICQNSLDARNDPTKPVHIAFDLSNVETKTLLGFPSLSTVIDSCGSYWAEEQDRKAIKFFKDAKLICEKNFIDILRISDFNTVGLTGSDKKQNSPWQNLVKSAGVSNKGADSGGSFGIGKSAPFASSKLRTVFYSTIDEKGKKAYQGVSRLATFLNEQGETTAGRGYFGDTKDNSAVLNETFPIFSYKRKEIGTDIFILAFQKEEDWEDKILESILEGYLISIYQGDLTVTIGKIELNRRSLPQILEKYRDNIMLTYQYYQVLEDDSPWTDFEVAGMGKISLKITAKSGFRRKVLMARSNGMKIFDKDRYRVSLEFAGICILKEELNQYFRAMENPQHTKWESDRISDDPKERRKGEQDKKALFYLINEKVKELRDSSVVDELDAYGAGDFIPALTPEDISDSGKEEQPSDQIKGFTKLEKEEHLEGNKKNRGIGEEDLIDYKNLPEGEDSFDGEGDSVYDIPQGTSKGGTKGEEDIFTRSGGKDPAIGDADSQEMFIATPLKMRLFLVDESKFLYQLSFTPDISLKNAEVRVFFTGEKGYAGAKVASATDRRQTKLSCKNNMISIGNVTAKRAIQLQFALKSKEQFSMEVEVSGHQA